MKNPLFLKDEGVSKSVRYCEQCGKVIMKKKIDPEAVTHDVVKVKAGVESGDDVKVTNFDELD